MMELTKNYLPAEVEDKWYKHWVGQGYFNSTPDDRIPFTVVIPPPNVTGVLHMGHTLNETVQDILVRKARMTGFNACWVPGSDHASIATEAKVVEMLKEKGIEKKDISREEFLKYAFEWKEKYGSIIYSQIAKLGCSVDWNRVTFTMDDHYYKAVMRVFVHLYNKGLIYRGARMINWDPVAKTALSDEEVEYKDIRGKLYHLRYKLDTGKEEYIVIATQRPETIMGDTAICVNPNDQRYSHLKGSHALVPLINRPIPIIFDEYVDPEFGSGALKVTPAHDVNDYNLGLKYKLEVVDTMNEDGTLSAAAQIYVGEDRFVARKKIIAELKEKKFVVNEEDYQTRLGYSQRSGAVVEPRISTQWFVKVKELAPPALAAVTNGDIRIHPGDKFLATYKYWLENVKDWCISRQLWWGQQIPAWYDQNGNMVVAENEIDALRQWQAKFGAAGTPAVNLSQDHDVLDTWFSSWLWPMEVFHGITRPGNADINYYIPTSVLVTGQDIIFFWVARMIMAGMEFKKQVPFKDVYFTGMVRDKQGRKMSKQLGNSPDLLKLIETYGADGVRFGIMISSPAGNDLLFDEASLEQGRNFNNKLWNALKLVKLWEAKVSSGRKPDSVEDNFALHWFANRFKEGRVEVEMLLSQFRLSEALKTIYSLIWDDFCSWYLEWIKPGHNQPVDKAVFDKTTEFFTDLMQLLHPFMPFITEEIFHLLGERKEDLCVRQFPPPSLPDSDILLKGKILKEAITAIRDAKNKSQIKPKEEIELHLQTAHNDLYLSVASLLSKQVNAKKVAVVADKVPQSIAVVLGKDKFYIQTEHPTANGSQKEDLLKERDYLKRFLLSVENKLGNERFIKNAQPDVVALERKKKTDAEAKLKVVEDSLAGL